MNPREHIYIHYEGENCRLVAQCNGIPFADYTFGGRSILSLPLNQFLRKNNTVTTILLPEFADGLEAVSTDVPPKVTGSIRYYDAARLSAGPETGQQLQAIDITGYAPHKTGFHNEHLDFSASILSWEPVAAEAVEDFCLSLRNHFKAAEYNSIEAAFRPKMRDFAAAYFQPEESYTQGFQTFLRNEFIPLGIEPVAPNLVLTPYLDKRLWQVRTVDGEALLLTRPDAEDFTYSIDVLVARQSNEFFVVR